MLKKKKSCKKNQKNLDFCKFVLIFIYEKSVGGSFMKKWLKIAGILILAFLLVFAVIAGKGGQKETKSLMVFKFNNGAEPETLDPSIMSGVPEFRIAMQIFEGLTVYNPKDLSPMPGVAKSWEISDDGLVYTFHL